jgi:LuxR family maltose regulon positive regulatory protein
MGSGAKAESIANPIIGMDLDSRGRGDLIERERLSERLRAARTPAVLLHAPAGYGKSVLLAQWERLDRRPFASVTLTDAHNDPAVLVASVVEAFAPIEPLPPSLAESIQNARPNFDLIGRRLEAAMRSRSVEAVLVLDELEHLQAEPALRLLESLLAAAGSASTVAMATRTATPIHVARLQAERRLTVLGAADLVMTKREATRFLAEAGVDAGETEVATIVAKTEGWPVALYLAGMTRRPGAARDLPETGFGGDERHLVDYMREEFLATAPPADVDFPSHLSYRQIAEELIVSPNTVKTQIRSAYLKLDVSSRHEAVEACRAAGVAPATAQREDG